MARIEKSVQIQRPVAKVFAYTTDAKSWPEWQSIITEAEQTSQGPMGVGTTFKGDLMGIPPTGKQIATMVICTNRFEGGKIAEDWEMIDLFGMMQQLGVIQQRAQAGF